LAKKEKIKKEPKPKKPTLTAASITPEPFETASAERLWCAKCTLHTRPVHFRQIRKPTNYNGKLLVIDTYLEEQSEPAWKKTKEIREKAGYSHDDVAYVGVLRCGPIEADDVNAIHMRCCRAFLLQAIKELNPKHIIGIGEVAHSAIINSGKNLSITKARGKPLNVVGLEGVTAFVTYHPEELLVGKQHLELEIVKDFRRVGEGTLTLPKVGLPGTDNKAVDTEFDPDGNLLTIGLSSENLAEALETTGAWKSIASRSLRETRVIIGHNVPGDIDMLLKNGLPVREEWLRGEDVLDSLILARMVNENRSELGKGAYSLGALMHAEFNVADWKKDTDESIKETGDARLWTTEQRTERCRLDAWASYILTKQHYRSIDPALRSYIHRVVFTLHRVGLAGAKVDRQRFNELGEQWSLDAAYIGDILTRSALALGMTEFQPTNKNHIRELVTERLGLAIDEKTKTGLTQIDKTTLKRFVTYDDNKSLIAGNETVHLLLEFSKSQKLASTWYGGDTDDDGTKKKSIGELVDKHGLLHFWINALGARTGRRSSGGGDEGTPESRNSQNWPVIARSIIVSRFDGGKIGAHDYKSLEPVLYGWIAKDKRLLDYFLNGGGYLDIAKDVLGKKIDKEKDANEYKLVKGMTLGTFYNMGDWKMAKDFWEKMNIKLSSDWQTHLQLVGEMRRDKFFPLFPRLEAYIHKQIREMEKTQQVVAPDGFVRHLPHTGAPERSASRKEKGHWKHLQNTAVNFPVQHMASMVTGAALMDIESELLKQHGINLKNWHEMLMCDPLDLPCSVIINEVHDEVTVDYNPKTFEEDKAIVLYMMKHVPSLHDLVPSFDIELKQEHKIGPAWAVNEVEK
jgi:uracil-DNA glycosylase family 4